MKRRKSLLFIGAAVVCSLPLGGKADFSGFIDQLRESNIPIDKILTQTGITRYELTRLLNAVECKDCINPDNSYLKAYTAKYWATFSQTPGKDFGDISYANAMFNNKDYYYCVAYVGDNGYMKGYPQTSPVCAGNFCGTRNVTNAEFLQVVMNMISKYIYSVYAINWGEAKSWINQLDQNGYQYKTFSSKDISTINDKANTCKTASCVLENTDQFNTYLKYCMFNLKSCGMVPFDKIKEGYWPVAELNVLSKQQIVSIDEAATYNINELIAGKLLVKIFSNMNALIGCTANNDYDCDGLTNNQDSCPNAYNPNQTDTDKDGIGDVCDDDIDGDGVKNPIGIVDDNGRIVIGLWDKNMDNCLFVINKDQKKDSKNTAMGDACGTTQNISLAIEIAKISGDLPQTVNFSAVHVTQFSQYARDFGDGSFASGENLTHTYTKSGIYFVRLLAKNSGGKQSLARTTVIVGHLASDKKAIQPLLKSIAINKNTTADLNLSTIGTFDYFEWNFSDGSTAKTTTPNLKKIFRTDGSIGVTIKGFVGKQIASVNAFTLGIGNSKGAVLKASVLNPDKETTVSFSTTIAGFLPRDVRSVGWDFGDGNTMQTQELSINHIYKISGQKAVIQTISLADGSTIKAIVTIYVVAPYLFDSYSLSFLPDMKGSTLSPLAFTTIIKGSFDTPLFFTTIYGDAQSQNFGTKSIRSPFVSQHHYISPGLYYPQTTLMLDACTNLSAQATIDIGGNDFCLDAKTNGTLKSLGCDMDKDGIPDICDTDIDGDGKPNLLGIITDPKQCNYVAQVQASGNGKYNKDGGINYDILNKQFQGVCSLDNDPFEYNPDQGDINNNNIGDNLDKAINGGGTSGNISALAGFLDIDNDGIPDSQDLCPLLAETYNGIQDTDGCPEIGVELNCENSRLQIVDQGGGLISCGNGIQDAGETCSNCPSDAGICSPNCGNGKIDPGETCQTCPSDVGSCILSCGNGKIDPGENCLTCPNDVGSCNPNCNNGKMDPGENCLTCPNDAGSCNPNCNNGKIDPGENCVNCPTDIGSCNPNCNNGKPDPGEDCINCPTDIGSCNPNCNNGKIDLGETCQTCPADVGTCISICGNGIQEVGETCLNCPTDVKSCTLTCGNGKIDLGETCLTCPLDVKSCISVCGNGNQEVGETCLNCPADVKSCTPNCGNGVQEVGETCTNCPSDAKDCDVNCSNGTIDIGETCLTCPVDVQRCFTECGNGIQDAGETCINCPVDGKYCDPNCGNNTIDAGETCQNCPVDVQLCFSLCGNGVTESKLGEQCDNGLSKNGKDGKCSATCTLLSTDICGNGKIDTGETCQTCPDDLKQLCFSKCGNGIPEKEIGEQCDNGIDNNGKDGKCERFCTLPTTCGNHTQEAGEDCFTCPEDSKGCLLIVAKECLQCPCPFADFSANLVNGDQIKAVLRNKTKKYPWAYSVAYEIGY